MSRKEAALLYAHKPQGGATTSTGVAPRAASAARVETRLEAPGGETRTTPDLFCRHSSTSRAVACEESERPARAWLSISGGERDREGSTDIPWASSSYLS